MDTRRRLGPNPLGRQHPPLPRRPGRSDREPSRHPPPRRRTHGRRQLRRPRRRQHHLRHPPPPPVPKSPVPPPAPPPESCAKPPQAPWSSAKFHHQPSKSAAGPSPSPSPTSSPTASPPSRTTPTGKTSWPSKNSNTPESFPSE